MLADCYCLYSFHPLNLSSTHPLSLRAFAAGDLFHSTAASIKNLSVSLNIEDAILNDLFRAG